MCTGRSGRVRVGRRVRTVRMCVSILSNALAPAPSLLHFHQTGLCALTPNASSLLGLLLKQPAWSALYTKQPATALISYAQNYYTLF